MFSHKIQFHSKKKKNSANHDSCQSSKIVSLPEQSAQFFARACF